MKAGKTMVNKRIVIIVVIAFAAALLYKLYPFGLIFFATRYAEQKRVQLLCKTDHQALLATCREVLQREDLEPGMRYKASQFPQVIRELAPSAVSMTRDNFLIIGIHGGMNRFGVHAYPEDFKVPFKGFEYGDKELIPGLWYYDEDYLHNPEYDKRIEALMKKGNEKAK